MRARPLIAARLLGSNTFLGRIEAGLVPGHEVDEQRRLAAGGVLAPMNCVVRHALPCVVLHVVPFVPEARLVDAELGLDDLGTEAAGIPADVEPFHSGVVERLPL